MARKNSQKTDTSGAIVFDSRTKAVMAQVGQDNVKEKVQAVKEVVPGRSNNEMILVLQYYDYCVERTIQAYLEDGAKEALKEWHFSENKVSKHKKKKSKKSQSNQNQSADQQKLNSQAQANNNTNARLSNGIVNDNVPTGINSTIHIGKNVSRTGVVVSTSSSSSSLSRGDSHVAASTAVKGESSLGPPSSHKDLNDSAAATGASKSESATDNESDRHKHTVQSSQHAVASSNSDTYHGSQESSLNDTDLPRVKPGVTQNSEKSKTKQRQKSVKAAKPGLEKSSKDLHRQTIALERLELVLTEEIDKAYKRIKNVFEEMKSCLREREIQISKEMDMVKVDAMETLKLRQQKAVELREDVDRSSRMSEADLAELRLHIKQFVSDRRIDDDLGRTTRFTYDSDHLAAEIKSFGKVIAVNKCAYSSRPSTSVSVSSSQDTLPPPIIPAQVLSTSANISMHSNDTNHVLSSEGATSKTIPNSDQETSQEHSGIAEPVHKEASQNLANPDQYHMTNFRLITNTESRTFSSRRRPARKNYQNTGNRDYSSRGGSNQRAGNSGGYFNTNYPHERIQYLGRGARRSRPYRGGGRGEMRGSYSAKPTTQIVTTSNK